jgi:uncharacterized LabA/DUF88 family protein
MAVYTYYYYPYGFVRKPRRPFIGAFVFVDSPYIMKKKTVIYIDGFNLYYGSLRKTPYKWLDLKSLFEKLLSKYHLISEVKYFTARISPRQDQDKSPERQKIYLHALQHYIPELRIYYGHYLSSKIKAKLCKPVAGLPAYVEVHKTEEKGSDVNLALHILNDAWLNKYESGILVSNDSDVAEALRLVTQEHKKEIGLIVPGDERDRRVSKELQKYAHFIKRIRKSVLKDSQLPNPIPGTNLYRPKEW